MKTILNLTTGEEIVRELNEEELAQQEIDEITQTERLAAKAEKEAAKAAAEAKLQALGLTTADLRALGLS